MSSLNLKRFCSTKHTGSPGSPSGPGRVNSYWFTIGRMRWRSTNWSWSFGSTGTARTVGMAPGILARLVSQENLELVRRMTDAFLAGNGPAALALMHPDVEFEANARPDAGVWRGPDGVRRAIAEWIGTWDDYSLEIRDYAEIPDGRVLVLWTERGRGKGSGIPIEHDGGYVVTLRDGEIARIHMYNDAGEALASVGR